MENLSELQWHQKPRNIILLLIFFFPLGLYFMWKNEIWAKKTRWIITGVISLIVIANIKNNSFLSHKIAPAEFIDKKFHYFRTDLRRDNSEWVSYFELKGDSTFMIKCHVGDLCNETSLSGKWSIANAKSSNDLPYEVIRKYPFLKNSYVIPLEFDSKPGIQCYWDIVSQTRSICFGVNPLINFTEYPLVILQKEDNMVEAFLISTYRHQNNTSDIGEKEYILYQLRTKKDHLNVIKSTGTSPDDQINSWED